MNRYHRVKHSKTEGFNKRKMRYQSSGDVIITKPRTNFDKKTQEIIDKHNKHNFKRNVQYFNPHENLIKKGLRDPNNHNMSPS